MRNTTSRIIFSAAAVSAVMLLTVPFAHGSVVFRDTFNRTGPAFGPNSGPEGSGTWTQLVTPAAAPTGNPGTFELNSNMAVATHNADDAIYQITVPTTSFASPYPTSAKFSDAPGRISWYINMQSSLTTPNGIGPAAGGMGVVLGSTVGAFGSTNGYILYIGNPGAADPIHLASYTGAAPPVDIITTWTPPFDTAGDTTDYLSYRVEYEPGTNIWAVYARDDGGAFADPLNSSGYTLVGTGVDSLYTSTALPLSGIIGSWRNPSLTTRFDNFAVAVVPEPSTFVLAGLGLVGLLGLARRRKVA